MCVVCCSHVASRMGGRLEVRFQELLPANSSRKTASRAFSHILGEGAELAVAISVQKLHAGNEACETKWNSTLTDTLELSNPLLLTALACRTLSFAPLVPELKVLSLFSLPSPTSRVGNITSTQCQSRQTIRYHHAPQRTTFLRPHSPYTQISTKSCQTAAVMMIHVLYPIVIQVFNINIPRSLIDQPVSVYTR